MSNRELLFISEKNQNLTSQYGAVEDLRSRVVDDFLEDSAIVLKKISKLPFSTATLFPCSF